MKNAKQSKRVTFDKRMAVEKKRRAMQYKVRDITMETKDIIRSMETVT